MVFVSQNAAFTAHLFNDKKVSFVQLNAFAKFVYSFVISVLKNGGNIIDATVCAALVQTAVDPQMCGIAGFGNIKIFLPIFCAQSVSHYKFHILLGGIRC